MNHREQAAVPLITFKNIVVTVTEDSDGILHPHCIESIPCVAPDTILNFQLAEPRHPMRDYQFEQPTMSGDESQLGIPSISKSGKMLTMCNETSDHGTISITLNVFDAVTPAKRGKFDPEVVNQPQG